MPHDGFLWVLLVGLMIGVVLLLRWIWQKPLSIEALASGSPEPSESVVTPKALLSPEEATLFNLIRVAAQDHMLVFAKLPILQVVGVQDRDEEARKAVMRTIQSVRLDAVLAHPGTLQAVTVVKFQNTSSGVANQDKRDRVVNTVLHAAGIGVVVLDPHQTYSVEHITSELGLAEEE